MRVLVVNAGSSSLKLRIVNSRDEVEESADLSAARSPADLADLRLKLRGLGKVDAVGHRIVHGATEFLGPTIIDEAVLAKVRSFTDLAPLHQQASLAALDIASDVMPSVPSVACFDTAFHSGMPAAAATYALPSEWRKRYGIKRFGFHGLSHSYSARRAAEMIDRDIASLKIVTCHLGAGASLAAVDAGRSVDTTMGFTPLEGLVMATRSGSIDPGLVLWLQGHSGTPAEELAATLEYRSGLLGLSGTSDMREVIERAGRGDEDSELALGVYLHRLRAGIASMAASMGGLDVLVFTGGVGEHSEQVRELASEGLGFLGVTLERELNRAGPNDRAISSPGSAVISLVISAREDLEIARQTREVLGY